MITQDILAEKTGQTNMGGYYKEKTIQVYKRLGVKKQYIFRYKYDTNEEHFLNMEDAMRKFYQASKYIK